MSLIEQAGLFGETAAMPSVAQMAAPKGYHGLHAFHKYWGKKPPEVLGFLISRLTDVDELVLDPFVGSGTAAIEAIRLNRRFIGIDINPTAVKLSRFILAPPNVTEVKRAFESIRANSYDAIQEAYQSTQTVEPISHYFWADNKMQRMWVMGRGRSGRCEIQTTDADIALHQAYESYVPTMFRLPRFFSNSRINSSPDMTLKSLFTGRALRNIEILLKSILALPPDLSEAMQLCLTAAVGQMSNMVFAVTGRGKTSGKSTDKIEVGSWVIGYWCPKEHFEVNVWNCFETRVGKLLSGLRKKTSNHIAASEDPDLVFSRITPAAVMVGDVLKKLPLFPNGVIDLIITDPPHSDRIPYLELSELWNSILGLPADLDSEIVVSNARERQKTPEDYTIRMTRFMEIAAQKVKENGTIVIMFNARDAAGWKFLNNFTSNQQPNWPRYVGCFPLSYSAGSVVQDNREGSLKSDYAIVFSHTPLCAHAKLDDIEGWQNQLPPQLAEG